MTTYSVNNTEQEKKIYCGREYEHNLTTNTQYNYIYVGDMPIALYVQGDTNAMYTLHTNYIGSIEKISDKNGNVVDSMSYTPFGQRRMFSDWSKTDTAKHLIDRGFTGQQHLDNFALINFNGRMYDPILAHFLSPDPYIQSPKNPLNYNRYSYCLFSPLQYVDPIGELYNPVFTFDGIFLGCTKEGYTGKVIICSSPVNFTDISADELLSRAGGTLAFTYDKVSNFISDEAKSKIWTHVVSQWDGKKVFDEVFSRNNILNKKIQYHSMSGKNWGTTENVNSKEEKIIFGNDNYLKHYETTVENLQASLIFHEWYGHAIKGYNDKNKNHSKCYEAVMDSPIFDKTTLNYKSFIIGKYDFYLNEEEKEEK